MNLTDFSQTQRKRSSDPMHPGPTQSFCPAPQAKAGEYSNQVTPSLQRGGRANAPRTNAQLGIDSCDSLKHLSTLFAHE